MSIQMDASLFALLRQFYSLTPPRSMKFPALLPVQQIHDFLLHNILQDDHFSAYPPSRQYQQLFWKWAIEKLENMATDSKEGIEDFEIDAQVYEHYLSLIPQGGPAVGSSNPATRSQVCGRGLFAPSRPSDSYITYYWDTFRPAGEVTGIDNWSSSTLLESRTMIESGTTGLRTWTASFVLADYLISNPDLVHGQDVLELGSGIGFVGIIVANLQMQKENTNSSASKVGSIWMTDVNDEVLERCESNAKLPCNKSSRHPHVRCVPLDWTDSCDDMRAHAVKTLINDQIKPIIVLGADILFDPSLIPALVATLKICLQGQIRALIALTVRNEATMQKFLNHSQDSGLSIDELEHRGAGRHSLSSLVGDGVDAHGDVKLLQFTLKSIPV